MSRSHSHHHGHHDHDHDHDHTPTVTSANERKVLLSFFLIFTFMVVEAVGGVLSGSLALLADAGHMLTDAAALALAYAAFRFGRRAADSKRTFGYLRFEVIAGFLNAVTLFGIVAWIVYEAWQRLSAPPVILAGPMMIVAVLGLLVNLVVLWIMTRGETDHVNVKGAILHVMGDLLGSVGAIVAAVVIYFTGWTPIDPILSVVVAVLILRSAWKTAGQVAAHPAGGRTRGGVAGEGGARPAGFRFRPGGCQPCACVAAHLRADDGHAARAPAPGRGSEGGGQARRAGATGAVRHRACHRRDRLELGGGRATLQPATDCRVSQS